MLVASRSLAWRRFSTTEVVTYEMTTKSRAENRPHWVWLCQPAAAPVPTPSASASAAKANGAQRGSARLLRLVGRTASAGAGRSCMPVLAAWLMRWPPSIPCGGR